MLNMSILLKESEHSFGCHYNGTKLRTLAQLLNEKINKKEDTFFSKIDQKIENSPFTKHAEELTEILSTKIKLTSSIAVKIETLCYLSYISTPPITENHNSYLKQIKDLFQKKELQHGLENNQEYKELQIYCYCKIASINRNYANSLLNSNTEPEKAKSHYLQAAKTFQAASDIESDESKKTKYLSQKLSARLYIAYIDYTQKNYSSAEKLAKEIYIEADQMICNIKNVDPLNNLIFIHGLYLRSFSLSALERYSEAVDRFQNIEIFSKKLPSQKKSYKHNAEPSKIEISAYLEVIINYYLSQTTKEIRYHAPSITELITASPISGIKQYGSNKQRAILSLYLGHFALLYDNYNKTLTEYKKFLSACKKNNMVAPAGLPIIILYCRANNADKKLNQNNISQLLKFLLSRPGVTNQYYITFENVAAPAKINPLTHKSNLLLATLITKHLNQYLYNLKTKPPKTLLSLVTLWDSYKKTLAPKNTKSKTFKILATQSDYLRFLDVSGKNSIDLAQKYLESELLQQYIASTATKVKLFRLIKSEKIREILTPIYTIEEKEEKDKHHTSKNRKTPKLNNKRRKRKKKKNRKKPNSNRQPSKQNENSRKTPPPKKPTKEDILLQQMLEHEKKIKKEIKKERIRKEKVELDKKQLRAIKEIFTENEITCSDFIKILNTITQFFSETSSIRDNNKKLLKFISLSESYGGYKKTVPNIIKTYRDEKLRKKIEAETRLLRGVKSIFTKYKISSQEFIRILAFFPNLASKISETEGDNKKLLKFISIVAPSSGYKTVVPRIIKKYRAEHSALRELQHQKIDLLEDIPEKYISIAKQFNAMFFGGLFRNKLKAYFADKPPASSHDYDLITLLPEHELLRKLKQLQSERKFRCFEKKGFGARQHYRIEFFDGKSVDVKFTNNSFKTIEEFVVAHARTLDFARNVIHVTHAGEIIDPMKGILAIKNKVLVPLQHNWCQKDNIQMFRALRFIFQDDLPVATNSSNEIEGSNEFVSQFTKPNSKEVPLPNEFNCADHNTNILKEIKDNKECFYPEFPETRDLYLIINNLDKLFLTGKGVIALP